MKKLAIAIIINYYYFLLKYVSRMLVEITHVNVLNLSNEEVFVF